MTHAEDVEILNEGLAHLAKTSKKKFKIRVSRQTIESAEFEVEASSKEVAQQIIIDRIHEDESFDAEADDLCDVSFTGWEIQGE
jgi:hypothetical protein